MGNRGFRYGAEKYKVCPKKVRSRLRIGWDLEKAVTHE